MVVCRVILLDQENFQVEIAKNVMGKVLFDIVKEKLNLNEADYFSLSYRNSQNERFWLNLDKSIDKQVESTKDMVFYWEVKFYPPSPDQLNEDLTQYLIVLQIRQDIFTGRLPASFQTLAVLGSYTAQGEIGDFDKTQHFDIDYLRPYSFAPNQSEELLMRICSLHKTCKGLTPAEADRYFLQNASKCALYGMDMYKVKDSASKEVKVGVCASGLYIYHGRLRMESFKWPRMIKISYKTNVFSIKVRPAEFEHLQKSLGFKLPTKRLAKRLWRIAVENHQFFRLKQPEFTDTGSLRGFGTRRWRMSGRTQAQLRNIGTPTRLYSRSNSITPSDTYHGFNQSTSTMPIPARRTNGDQIPDVNKNYNTFNEGVARMLVPSPSGETSPPLTIPDEGHRGTDRFMDVSHDDSGDYVPSESLDESGVPRGGNLGSNRRIPTADRRGPISSENLVNGDRGRQSESDILPSQTGTSQRAPNGQLRRPLPKERQPNGNGIGKTPNGDSRSSPEPVEESVLSTAGAPQLSFSNMNTQPYLCDKTQPSTTPSKPSVITRHPSSSSRPSTGTFGFGELPMPCFCLESAGIMPTGRVDNSVKLNVAERAEKIIKVGMPPTVKTTRMKFAEGFAEPDTRTTRSPPTVQTEKSHFSYAPNPKPDLNSQHTSTISTTTGGHERISETTTCTTERDGYIEKKVKHTITISGDEDLDNQLLLNAIQAVTCLDSNLGVDKIEIKTQSEYD